MQVVDLLSTKNIGIPLEEVQKKQDADLANVNPLYSRKSVVRLQKSKEETGISRSIQRKAFRVITPVPIFDDLVDAGQSSLMYETIPDVSGTIRSYYSFPSCSFPPEFETKGLAKLSTSDNNHIELLKMDALIIKKSNGNLQSIGAVIDDNLFPELGNVSVSKPITVGGITYPGYDHLSSTGKTFCTGNLSSLSALSRDSHLRWNTDYNIEGYKSGTTIQSLLKKRMFVPLFHRLITLFKTGEFDKHMRGFCLDLCAVRQAVSGTSIKANLDYIRNPSINMQPVPESAIWEAPAVELLTEHFSKIDKLYQQRELSGDTVCCIPLPIQPFTMYMWKIIDKIDLSDSDLFNIIPVFIRDGEQELAEDTVERMHKITYVYILLERCSHLISRMLNVNSIDVSEVFKEVPWIGNKFIASLVDAYDPEEYQRSILDFQRLCLSLY